MKLKHKLTSVLVFLSALVMAHPGHHHDSSTQGSLGHIVCSVLFLLVVIVGGVFAFRAIKKRQKSN